MYCHVMNSRCQEQLGDYCVASAIANVKWGRETTGQDYSPIAFALERERASPSRSSVEPNHLKLKAQVAQSLKSLDAALRIAESRLPSHSHPPSTSHVRDVSTSSSTVARPVACLQRTLKHAQAKSMAGLPFGSPALRIGTRIFPTSDR